MTAWKETHSIQPSAVVVRHRRVGAKRSGSLLACTITVRCWHRWVPIRSSTVALHRLAPVNLELFVVFITDNRPVRRSTIWLVSGTVRCPKGPTPGSFVLLFNSGSSLQRFEATTQWLNAKRCSGIAPKWSLTLPTEMLPRETGFAADLRR